MKSKEEIEKEKKEMESIRFMLSGGSDLWDTIRTLEAEIVMLQKDMGTLMRKIKQLERKEK